MLGGSSSYLASILPHVKFTTVNRWERISSVQNAWYVRRFSRNFDTQVLGIGDTGLWARSPIRRNGGRTVLVDDGASSLKLPFSQLLDDRAWLGDQVLYRRALHLAVGPVVRNARDPEIYTAFPVEDSPWPVARHNYAELRSAVSQHPPEWVPNSDSGNILVDSGYALTLGREWFDWILPVAIHEWGVDCYIPHRRTPTSLVDWVKGEFGLAVIRPDVSMELLIGPWTKAGVNIYTPPAALAVTARMFEESPGRVTAFRVSRWLEKQIDASQTGISPRIERVLRNALLVERHLEFEGILDAEPDEAGPSSKF